MWILYAFGSALFAGITSVLAKCGIKDVDSDTATALRTIVVLFFSWFIVFVSGVQDELADAGIKTFVFLILSGVAAGASWLCYFKALQTGDINKVAPIDKSSTVIAVILAFIFLGEQITILKFAALVMMTAGTYFMIEEKTPQKKQSGKWMLYAFGSAIFAALTSILGKIGVENINSNLGTAVRTAVVLVMAWIVVFAKKSHKTIKNIGASSWIFLIFSGIATGLSWLCYYKALQDGPASAVVPIDKLSILVTVGFGCVVFKEKLTVKSSFGLALITAGTLVMLI